MRLLHLAFTTFLIACSARAAQPSAARSNTAGATPPSRLQVAEGFRVDLLYSPDKDLEGSWTAMCVDAKGRLIVGNQYNEGLFRVTLSAVDCPGVAAVQKIPVDLSGTQGLLWAFDSLYALVSQNARHKSGLYRLTDTNGDDQLDQVELLKPLEGGGDHGWHGLLLSPDRESIVVVAGNHTRAPVLQRSRVPLHWGEDQLLPRMPDARGHAKGILAPGGCFYRVSPDGQDWELLASGFRNTYDAAFHPDGDLFTFDSDMEWDMNTPWYRPTRVCLVVSGAEFGWRNGSGKWPSYYADSLPSVLDIGPGSPTGVEFGTQTQFPENYQRALFLGDWSYGKIYAVHLVPDGAAYRGTSEVFISGAPLPTTDIVANPFDGALYFITGGWNIQTGLYRVTHTGGGSSAPALPTVDRGIALRSLRHELEAYHGRADPRAVEKIWPLLSHSDRYIRYAARVALESQTPATWRDRVLQEFGWGETLSSPDFPQAPESVRAPESVAPPAKIQRADAAGSIAALMALARVSRQDAVPETKAVLLGNLEKLAWNTLDETQRLDFLRALSLTFIRLGPPGEAERQRWLRWLEPLFPSNTRALNSELCAMLVYLQSPAIASRGVSMLEKAVTQGEQMDYARALRVLRAGWTFDLRQRYFRWFLKAGAYRGGASFAGFVKMIKSDAVAALTEQERDALTPVIEALPEYDSPLAAAGAEFQGRTEAHEWTVQSLARIAESSLRDRDFERGRRMFAAAGCFSCHRVDGEGGAVGPDLTGAGGRFSPRDLLESIVEPSKTISDLYGNVVLTLHDGDTITGRIVYLLRQDAVQICPNLFDPADTVTVDRKEVLSIKPARTSPMPEALLSPLNGDEVMDLLAYLLSGGDSKHGLFRKLKPPTATERTDPSPSSQIGN